MGQPGPSPNVYFSPGGESDPRVAEGIQLSINAIATALRKFDGEPEPARPIRPAATGGWWARSRQPQFAMGMSLALIAGIGVPATWIAIQNGALNPPNEPSSPAASRSAAPPAMRDTTDVQAATAAPPEPASSPGP